MSLVNGCKQASKDSDQESTHEANEHIDQAEQSETASVDVSTENNTHETLENNNIRLRSKQVVNNVAKSPPKNHSENTDKVIIAVIKPLVAVMIPKSWTLFPNPRRITYLYGNNYRDNKVNTGNNTDVMKNVAKSPPKIFSENTDKVIITVLIP